MKNKFKTLKRKAVKSLYSNFVNELKESDPGKWYKMAQKIGALDQMNSNEISVDQLKGLTDQESAELIAQHFAAVSNQYLPLNREDLPCYLPAEKPPQVDEISVFEKLNKLKNTPQLLALTFLINLEKNFLQN